MTFNDDAELVANGVEFLFAGKTYVVRAKKEVVLCAGKNMLTLGRSMVDSYTPIHDAGTYQSPQLLELSGIGMRSVLEKHDIPVRVELPVGENLQVNVV